MIEGSFSKSEGKGLLWYKHIYTKCPNIGMVFWATVTQLYIDNIPVRGLATRYIQKNGEPETIPGNSAEIYTPPQFLVDS